MIFWNSHARLAAHTPGAAAPIVPTPTPAATLPRPWGHPGLPGRRHVRPLTRANLLEALGEDCIRTARAKGLAERTVVGKHALRSGLTPLVTVFGLDLGAPLGGAVLTEAVFNLRGLGYQALTAIRGNDLPVSIGVTLIAAFFIVVINLIVDLLYGVIDSRVRLGRGGTPCRPTRSPASPCRAIAARADPCRG